MDLNSVADEVADEMHLIVPSRITGYELEKFTLEMKLLILKKINKYLRISNAELREKVEKVTDGG